MNLKINRLRKEANIHQKPLLHIRRFIYTISFNTQQNSVKCHIHFSKEGKSLKNNLVKIKEVGSGWTVLEVRFACLQILFS